MHVEARRPVIRCWHPTAAPCVELTVSTVLPSGLNATDLTSPSWEKTARSVGISRCQTPGSPRQAGQVRVAGVCRSLETPCQPVQPGAHFTALARGAAQLEIHQCQVPIRLDQHVAAVDGEKNREHGVASSEAATARQRRCQLRLRRHHRQVRSAQPTGRASMGLPSEIASGPGRVRGPTGTPWRLLGHGLQADRLQVAESGR